MLQKAKFSLARAEPGARKSVNAKRAHIEKCGEVAAAVHGKALTPYLEELPLNKTNVFYRL